MPTRTCALVILAQLATGLPVVAADLDKDDKEWLEEVRPIILSEERQTFEDLEDKADREEFKKIFWARRDPDPETPENEFEDEYRARKTKADHDYRLAGRLGTHNDCGRVYALLGEPDDVRQQGGAVSPGLRIPEAWVYGDRPGLTFNDGELVIRFDEECDAPGGLDKVLEQIASSKVKRPNIGYTVDDDGHLVTLEDQLPKASPARALLDAPRQDFPAAIDVRFMKVSEGVTGVIGLIRGEPPDLPVETRDGQTVADVVVATAALAADGTEAGWTEQPVAAAVQPDGSFLASFGMGVPPGNYTLKAGVVLPDGRGSLVSESVEVPSFEREITAADGTTTRVPSVASILFVREIEDLPPGTEKDPEDHFAAFRLGQTQLHPYFGRDLSQSDTVSFFYLIYDLTVDPDTEKADAVVAFSILKDGKTPVAQAPESPVTTAVMASAIGPVPLKTYPPGDYVVQIRVTDHLAKKTVVKNEKFRIHPAEGEAP
jgi:GWxTD domain-containing protein